MLINNPGVLPFSSSLTGAVSIGPSTVSLIATTPGIISSVNSLAAANYPVPPNRFPVVTAALPSVLSAAVPSAFPAAGLVTFARETGLTAPHITSVLDRLPYSPTHSAALTTPRFVNDFIDAIVGITEVDFEERDIRVPIGEIHRPKIKGCEATYTHDTQNNHDNFLEIKIFGIGGADHKSMSLGFGYKVTANEECLRFSQEMKLRFTKNRWRSGNEFTSVEVVKVTDNYFQEKLFKCPTCRKDYTEVKNSKDYEGHGSYNIIADTSITKKIKTDTGTDFNLGIDISELGVKNDLKISTKVIKEITCVYSLVKGYDYLAYAPKSKSSLLCWTWNKL